jgi:prepilin-type N-terminal cleavage/methylation domain-containing protein
MNRFNFKRTRGFSLLELLISMVVGLIIMGAATQLFKSAMDATTVITQTAEIQANARAAVNMMSKDISMAGSGLTSGGFALAYGAGATASRFAVDQNRTWLNNNAYPSGQFGNPPTIVPYWMYGLIPGPANGMELGGPGNIPATNQPADAITSVYVDYSFPLNLYQITAMTATTITLQPPNPAPTNPFPQILDPTGIKVGDLIMLSNAKGTAVVEVTGINAGGTVLTFAANDPLNMNQPANPPLNSTLAYLATVGTATANRILSVTYFAEVPNNGQLPRLMRQVNGQTPVPVADNIIGLTFTYDMCDQNNNGGGAVKCANITDPIAKGFTLSQIHKVNVTVLAQALMASGANSRSTALTTSISTRNLSFKDRYN